MDLTDSQWEILQGVFVEPRRGDGKGRPPRDARAVLNGVLWILRTGAPWKDLPPRYPPYQTCHRHFQKWQKDGRFEVILQVLAEDLVHRGKLDLSEGAIDETKLVEATLDSSFAPRLPENLLGDLAYDSDPLDKKLQEKYDINLIAPHKSNRSKPPTQDGRVLRRFCRRWKVERFFAWLHNFRRLVTRWEYKEGNFLGKIGRAHV